MEIDIYKEPNAYELRLYVACHTDKIESAKKIEALLNGTETLNHIGLPEQLPYRKDWTVKAFCQVHKNDDSDVSNGDAGPGSVFDVFKNVLKAVHDSEEFSAKISPNVRKVLNTDDVKTWSAAVYTQINPQLIGIDKLADILHNTDLENIPLIIWKLND